MASQKKLVGDGVGIDRAAGPPVPFDSEAVVGEIGHLQGL